MRFTDRVDAGRRLAGRLERLAGPDVVVLGLPRGGVPVAFEVAKALGAPLDVIIVRKLGVPHHTELGLGAIGEDGVTILNDEIVRMCGATESEIAAVEEQERAELERRTRRFRAVRPRLDLTGRTALIVDDGIATGSTALAACEVARLHGAARVVLAVPVAPLDFAPDPGMIDEFVCLHSPDPFGAVGRFYRDFSPTTDDQVVECLERSTRGVWIPKSVAHPSEPGGVEARDEDVSFRSGAARLRGHLAVPEHAVGLVAFAHGSGSSAASPRNRYVAEVLGHAGLGTLLFDLLTIEEERRRSNVFDIELLAGRLLDATAWLHAQPGLDQLPIGYFGASTGAAAALRAAATSPVPIAAVVSRGGRPDLAGARLADVQAPTLLIVGSRDAMVLDLNREALARLGGIRELTVVRGASHLFEEPGTLDTAAAAARDWFLRHFTR